MLMEMLIGVTKMVKKMEMIIQDLLMETPMVMLMLVMKMESKTETEKMSIKDFRITFNIWKTFNIYSVKCGMSPFQETT